MARKILKGIVVSSKCNKTVTISTTDKVLHKKYKKYMTTRKKYTAHDECNMFKIGDEVRIMESKPISKSKKWIVLPKEGELV